MKKLLGTCLAAAAICACGFGSASAVNWQVFGQDSAGITWSIDQDSVQKNDKTATVMIKAQDSEGYHFIATEEFNHKKKTVKTKRLYCTTHKVTQNGKIKLMAKIVQLLLVPHPKQFTTSYGHNKQNKVKNNIYLIRQSSSKELLFCVYMQSMSLSYRTKRVGKNLYNTR